jgi:hypothetical protein
MAKFASEAELAKLVVTWLRSQNWEVWQEVEAYKGTTIDIVAKMGPKLWAIEAKRSLSLQVIAQAWDRRKLAHWSSIAVPTQKRSWATKGFVKDVLKTYGIGMITVSHRGINVVSSPTMMRKPRLSWVKKLDEIPQDFCEAGSARGGHWTPFKRTCIELQRYLIKHPGACMKEVVDNVKHHYKTDSTARSCLSQWIKDGIVPGVTCERDGKLLRLYYNSIAKETDPQGE